MYAIIRTGGKQYRVAEGETVQVERDVLAGAEEGSVTFGDVLMVGGEEPKVGSPLVDGASVKGTILSEERGPKVIVFRKKKRKMYKKKNGHRQDLVNVRIDKIDA